MNIESFEDKKLLTFPEPTHQELPDGPQNGFTKTLLHIVSYLHDPILYSSSAIHRIVCPWQEERQDLCGTWEEEITLRVLTASSLLVTVPIGLVAAALALPIRCLATAVNDQDFCYMRGAALEKKLPPEFSLMTWNVCCHEGGMDLSTGGMVSWKYRIDRIIDRILEKDPDVLCLQEVQSTDVALALIDRLKEVYPHSYYNLGINPIKSYSGLIVFSKFQTALTFTPFEEAAGWAKYENKGVASLILENKVHVCFTHLQYGDESDLSVFRAREKQIAQITSIMQRKNLPSILAGDLNLNRYGKVFEASTLTNHFDIINNPAFTWNGYFIEKMWKGVSAPSHTIEESVDYIGRFKRLEDEVPLKIESEYVIGYETTRDFALTDHHGIFAKVSV